MRYFVLGLITILSIVAVACQGAQPAAAPDPTSVPTMRPTPTPVPPSPLELLRQSFDRMTQVKSFRAHVLINVDAEGQPPVEMSFDAEMAQDNTARLVATLGGSGVQMSYEMITSPSEAYVKVPLLGWYRMGLEDVAEATDQPVGMLDIDRLRTLLLSAEMPWELLTVESLGREQVAGVETEHLSIQVDLAEVWEHFGQDEHVQSFQSQFGGDVSDEDLDEILLNRVEVWIDEQGFVRRGVLEPRLGDQASLKVDVAAFDFNEDISIELPREYQEGMPDVMPGAGPVFSSDAPMQLWQ